MTVSLVERWAIEALGKALQGGGAALLDHVIESLDDAQITRLQQAIERVRAARKVTVTVEAKTPS